MGPDSGKVTMCIYLTYISFTFNEKKINTK